MKIFHELALAQALRTGLIHTIDGEILLATQGRFTAPGDWAYTITEGSLDRKSNRRSRANVLANRNRVFLNTITGSSEMAASTNVAVVSGTILAGVTANANDSTGRRKSIPCNTHPVGKQFVSAGTMANTNAAQGRALAAAFGEIIGRVTCPTITGPITGEQVSAPWVHETIPIGYGLVAAASDVPNQRADNTTPYLIYHGQPYRLVIHEATYGTAFIECSRPLDGTYLVAPKWGLTLVDDPQDPTKKIYQADTGLVAWRALLGTLGKPVTAIDTYIAGGIQLDPNVVAPRTAKGVGWVASNLYSHGTLSVPSGRVSVELHTTTPAWADLMAAHPIREWYASRQAGDYHGVLPPDAIAGLLRGSVDHDRFGAAIERAEAQELVNAATEVEATDLHINFQLLQSGVLARTFQKWAKDASKIKDTHVLSKRPKYTIGDFNKKWAGKREHFFTVSNAIEATSVVNTTIAAGTTDTAVARVVTWVVSAQLTVTTATAAGRQQIVDLLKNNDEYSLVVATTDQAVQVDDVFEEYPELVPYTHFVESAESNKGDVLVPPFFRGVDMDSDAERFLTIKGGQDDELLKMALSVLESERALLAEVFND